MPDAGPGLSDNEAKLRKRNEQTLLVNICDTLDEGLTTVLRWWADWHNASAQQLAGIEFEVSRDFLTSDPGAREIRAIHSLYKDGVIPVEVVYEYLRRAEVVPDWMDVAEFRELLGDPTQFPNMAEVLAWMRGYPDAKAFHKAGKLAA